MTTEVQWSELQRDPKSVAALVDEHGDVRVRRRDGPALVLSREDHASAIEIGSLTAARALSRALVHMPLPQAADVLRDEFPWVDLLPTNDLSVFVGEFVRAVYACAELGSWKALAQMIIEWKATAEIYADPELAASLARPLDGDYGPVPPPTDFY